METTVTGRHLEITDAIRQYASDKMGKLPRYFDRLHRAEVVADKVDAHTFDVEVIVHAEHTERFVGRSKGEDLYACIDACVDKLERQLTDHKDRIRHRKGKTPMSG